MASARGIQRAKMLASGVKANASTTERTTIRTVRVKWLSSHSARMMIASQATMISGSTSARSHALGTPPGRLDELALTTGCATASDTAWHEVGRKTSELAFSQATRRAHAMALETPTQARKRQAPGSQNTAGLDLDELRQLWLKPLWLVLSD